MSVIKKIRAWFAPLVPPPIETAGETDPPAIVRDFTEFCIDPPDKRALVTYVRLPLLLPPGERDRELIKMSKAEQIPRALNELGYSVDVIEWNDTEAPLPDRPYDLYIGHHSYNFERISQALPEDVIRIYFASCMYWKEHNRLAARRVADLAERRGISLPADRVLSEKEEYANRISDGIICLGSEQGKESFSDFPRVFNVGNAIHPIDWSGHEEKDFAAGKQHFLFWSGPGNIHKGLDLLLEVFAETDLHLHVCQRISSGFAQAFERELRLPNIHVYGYIPMRERGFEELVEQCDWVISASCAEGQSRGVLESMGYGLIPLVPTNTSIELDDFGIDLGEASLDQLREGLREATEMSVDECRRRSRLAQETVSTRFAPERFVARFREAVREIVDTARVRA